MPAGTAEVEPRITRITRMKTERPIIMSGDNPRLIREGRKTQTRRIIKPQPPGTDPQFDGHPDGGGWVWTGRSEKNYVMPRYGVPGDRLWVREAFNGTSLTPNHPMESITYLADAGAHERSIFKWTPSIHMPRKFCRSTLQILKVRVERLNNISESDAKAEGMDPLFPPGVGPAKYVLAYRKLWDSLHGKGAWRKNPWVWVIEFKLA